MAAVRIGLTGGIGSGKSAAAQVLRGLGAHVIDADAISRQLTAAGGRAIEPIRSRFGARSIGSDGAMDRDAMRAAAFADPSVRRALEAIIHPLVQEETATQAAAATSPAIVFEIPLLVESGHWRAKLDRVLVIDCDEAVQLARVTQRPGWTADTARSVLAQQASRSTRRAAADAVIDNSAISLEELAAQVRAVWSLWIDAPT